MPRALGNLSRLAPQARLPEGTSRWMLSRPPTLAALLLTLASACAADPGDALKSAADGGTPVGSEGVQAVVDAGGAVQNTFDASSSVPPPQPEATTPVDTSPAADAAAEAIADAGVDDAMMAPEIVTCPTCPLELQYEVSSAMASSQQIQFNVKIINHGTEIGR